ncbi:MAG TPA: hypothetical protein VGN16_21000 [Acidobacteriaceae bacterium]
MKKAGYTFKSKSKCDVCGAAIEFWKTLHDKWFLTDAPTSQNSESEEVIDHRITCDPTKRGIAPSAARPVSTPRTFQAADRERCAQRLLQTSQARIVVALYDDGFFAFTYRQGISPEDLRHELITAANKIRNQLGAKQ